MYYLCRIPFEVPTLQRYDGLRVVNFGAYFTLSKISAINFLSALVKPYWLLPV